MYDPAAYNGILETNTVTVLEPESKLTASPLRGRSPLSVTFDGTASVGSQASLVIKEDGTVLWSSSDEPDHWNPTLVLTTPGIFTVMLVVFGGVSLASLIDDVTIEVLPPEPPASEKLIIRAQVISATQQQYQVITTDGDQV